MAKAIEKLRQFLADQGVQLSPCAKSSSNQDLFAHGESCTRKSRNFEVMNLRQL